jgi:hypothetical protein
VGYSWEHTISPERALERELYTLYASSWVDADDSDRIDGGFICCVLIEMSDCPLNKYTLSCSSQKAKSD